MQYLTPLKYSCLNCLVKKNQINLFSTWKQMYPHCCTINQYQRAITPKVVNQFGFECSAYRLMVLNISVKFHEIIWNSFTVTERIQVNDKNHNLQCSKGYNFTIMWTRNMVLVFCISSHSVNISVKFHEIICNRFAGYRANTRIWPKSLFAMFKGR